MFSKFSAQQIVIPAQRPAGDGRVDVPLRDIQSLAFKHGGKPVLGSPRFEINKTELLKLYSVALHYKNSGQLLQDNIKHAAQHATAGLRLSVGKLVIDPLVPEHRKTALQESLMSGEQMSFETILEWCKQLAHSQVFTALQPAIEQLILAQESGTMPGSPTKDTNSVGKATEAKVLPMLTAGLPDGWTILDGVNLSKIDGTQHPPAEGIKAEFDALVLDSLGEVKYLVEVKTAKNNPLAVMYADYPKLSAAVDAVKGRSIEVTKCGPAKAITTSIVNVASNVKVVYIISSVLTPASAEQAYRIVRTIHLTKKLSWDIQLWSELSWRDVKGEYVSLGVPPKLLDDSDDELSAMLERLQEEVCVFSTMQQPSPS